MKNLVHKHAHRYNRASVQMDKKKALKKGKIKHKKSYNKNTILF